MKKYEEFVIKINKEDTSEGTKTFRNGLFEIIEKLVAEKYEKDLIGDNEIEITYSPNKSNEGMLAQFDEQEDLTDCSKIN